MNVRDIILTAFALLVCVSCKKEKEMTLSGLNIRDFQTEVDGQLTDLYVLRNENGMEACITNYGGRVVSLMVPDRNGKMEDIVCGYPTIADYLATKQNFGATIGQDSEFNVYAGFGYLSSDAEYGYTLCPRWGSGVCFQNMAGGTIG